MLLSGPTAPLDLAGNPTGPLPGGQALNPEWEPETTSSTYRPSPRRNLPNRTFCSRHLNWGRTTPLAEEEELPALEVTGAVLVQREVHTGSGLWPIKSGQHVTRLGAQLQPVPPLQALLNTWIVSNCRCLLNLHKYKYFHHAHCKFFKI